MYETLLVIHLLIAIALIIVILLQRSDNDGFGLGSGSGGAGGSGLFSARGQANFLTRTTAILATVFMLNSLLISIVSETGSQSILDKIEDPELSAEELLSPEQFEQLGGEAPAKKEQKAPAVPLAE